MGDLISSKITIDGYKEKLKYSLRYRQDKSIFQRFNV